MALSKAYEDRVFTFLTKNIRLREAVAELETSFVTVIFPGVACAFEPGLPFPNDITVPAVPSREIDALRHAADLLREYLLYQAFMPSTRADFLELHIRLFIVSFVTLYLHSFN
jgi:hypothetical protein